MSLDLYVDGTRWRSHLRATADRYPGIVPVAKGNGYGFGLASLARRAEWLGCSTIAVGTYREVGAVRQRFSGDVLVLEPWRPFLTDVPYDDRIVHTVGRDADLAALATATPSPRVVLEGLTSMRRHGFAAPDLVAARRAAHGVRIQGHALHLPMDRSYVAEAQTWLAAAPSPRWYVSHLSRADLDDLHRRHPEVQLLPRIGTELWLGDRGSLSVRATVLDAHRVRRGDRVGYRQRRVPREGVVLVVSGGTAHGIGLEAPAAGTSPRRRAATLARGGLDAAGRALSPYVVGGRRRWFVEPPHMQVSMILVPADVEAPGVGDEIEAQVRFTTTLVDAVHLS
ncbi:MAG: alanine racemase [Nocardioidaceae bacterium]